MIVEVAATTGVTIGGCVAANNGRRVGCGVGVTMPVGNVRSGGVLLVIVPILLQACNKGAAQYNPIVSNTEKPIAVRTQGNHRFPGSMVDRPLMGDRAVLGDAGRAKKGNWSTVLVWFRLRRER